MTCLNLANMQQAIGLLLMVIFVVLAQGYICHILSAFGSRFKVNRQNNIIVYIEKLNNHNFSFFSSIC